MGSESVLGVSNASHLKAVEPPSSPFWGFLLFVTTLSNAERSPSARQDRWGSRDMILGVRQNHVASHSKGQSRSDPQFWGFSSIYVYILRCRTIDFGIVTHMDIWGGACFRESACHCILHKCVVRFVSDTAEFLVCLSGVYNLENVAKWRVGKRPQIALLMPMSLGVLPDYRKETSQ